jgi:hypothetical protein
MPSWSVPTYPNDNLKQQPLLLYVHGTSHPGFLTLMQAYVGHQARGVHRASTIQIYTQLMIVN